MTLIYITDLINPRVPTHPGKSWIFPWIFQALESPENESLRSWKVLENEDPG